MAMFKGKTQDAQCPILGAAFWKKGLKLEGRVSKEFQTQNGPCFEITLKTPLKVNGNMEKKVAIGALAGLHMALNAAGVDQLAVNDSIILECTGETATTKGNARVDFQVALNRPD